MTGATGLVAFWVPIAARKGGRNHRRWGRLFVRMMLATGGLAIGISLTTLIDPAGTHPHLLDHPELGHIPTMRGIFGWMMLYLAILTVCLAWYGKVCLESKRDRRGHLEWRSVAIHVALTITSANCMIQGITLGQPLMIGISMVGFATVGTNAYFVFKANPGPKDWLLEHIKGLVGAGISVYTAFFAFGAVRLLPEAALTPALWAVPLITGLVLIIYHQRAVRKGLRRAQAARHAV
ncbi:MAG: hypothetical protein AAFY02_08900 [Pseudomonadota bacterium]